MRWLTKVNAAEVFLSSMNHCKNDPSDVFFSPIIISDLSYIEIYTITIKMFFFSVMFRRKRLKLSILIKLFVISFNGNTYQLIYIILLDAEEYNK